VTDLRCHCPGVPFMAGLSHWPDDHWAMWDCGDLGGPEPLATQEDGLCDSCAGRDGEPGSSCRIRADRMLDETRAIRRAAQDARLAGDVSADMLRDRVLNELEVISRRHPEP